MAMRIAVVGAGIAGLGAAWALAKHHHVTLFEAAPSPGGHSNTVVIERNGQRTAVDTGFIVYNDVNYPHLLRLFAHLGVPTEPSNMSFSVSLDEGRFEYASLLPWGPVAQVANLFKPRFLRMLWEIPKFYRDVRARLPSLDPRSTLGEVLAQGGYGETYRFLHLLPMASAIWSTPIEWIERFPARQFVKFYEEHGLLRFSDRPKWRTVSGGSREYVRRLLADFSGTVRTATPVRQVRRDSDRIWLATAAGEEAYDHVVLAVHGNDARRILADADDRERSMLDAYRCTTNRAILHRDPSFMPRRRAAWASWNYHAQSDQPADRVVPVTYWMNRLQNLPPMPPLFVSLNPWREPEEALLDAEFHYDHPVFTVATAAANAALPSIQGRRRTWFCGAYTRHGFHEDGLRSGFAVAAALGAPPPWGLLPSDASDSVVSAEAARVDAA